MLKWPRREGFSVLHGWGGCTAPSGPSGRGRTSNPGFFPLWHSLNPDFRCLYSLINIVQKKKENNNSLGETAQSLGRATHGFLFHFRDCTEGNTFLRRNLVAGLHSVNLEPLQLLVFTVYFWVLDWQLRFNRSPANSYMIADLAKRMPKYVFVWNHTHRGHFCTVIISNPPYIDRLWLAQSAGSLSGMEGGQTQMEEQIKPELSD